MTLNPKVFFVLFFASQPTNGGPRRVLFRTQPDVLYLTLQDGRPATSLSPPESNEEDTNEENVCARNRQLDIRTHRQYKRIPGLVEV